MIIAVASEGKNVQSNVASRFARAPYFLLFDEKGYLMDTVETGTGEMAHGAAGMAVQRLAQKSVSVAIGPKAGPNAIVALERAKIDFYSADGGSVQEAVKKYLAGELS